MLRNSVPEKVVPETFIESTWSRSVRFVILISFLNFVMFFVLLSVMFNGHSVGAAYSEATCSSTDSYMNNSGGKEKWKRQMKLKKKK